MTFKIIPSGQACGAEILGIDLAAPLSPKTIKEIRAAWLQHHVLAFPGQMMSDDDLERFTLYFGPFGDDPFISPIPGRDHIIAVKRAANETAPIFAETWHTDWSFQDNPPAGTCLFGITIPDQGGDTLFVNQHKSLQQMPAELRARLDGKMAVHSAKNAYAPNGFYGDNDVGRSMDIRPSDDANEERLHPIIREHPETGELGLFGCVGYIVGIDGMEDSAASDLLFELYRWQTRPEFQYRHKWQPNTLLMWDNRSLLHMATGGYAGQDRLLHRTTIGAYVPSASAPEA